MNLPFVHRTKNKRIPRGACKTCQENNQKVCLWFLSIYWPHRKRNWFVKNVLGGEFLWKMLLVNAFFLLSPWRREAGCFASLPVHLRSFKDELEELDMLTVEFPLSWGKKAQAAMTQWQQRDMMLSWTVTALLLIEEQRWGVPGEWIWNSW